MIGLHANSRVQDLTRRVLDVCNRYFPAQDVRVELRPGRTAVARGTRRYAFLPSHLGDATSVALDVVIDDPRTVALLTAATGMAAKLRVDLAADLPLNVTARVVCVRSGHSLAVVPVLGELMLGETLIVGLCMSNEFQPVSLIDAIVRSAREHKEKDGDFRAALTALLVEHYKDQDVITAADMNKIFAELRSLSTEVRRLNNEVEVLKNPAKDHHTVKFQR